MLNYIGPKLEMDVIQASELNEAMELAYVHKMSAIVIHPDLVADAIMQRFRRQATYHIITTVDWPKGEKFGVTKLHNMSVRALSCDGFEIMLCTRPPGESKREMLELTEFIRRHLPQVQNIRFVLGCLSKEQEIVKNLRDIQARDIQASKVDVSAQEVHERQAKDDATAHAEAQKDIRALCRAIHEIPAPNLLRTDINLRAQQAKANITAHIEMLALIKECVNRPVKVCGNINSAKTVMSCKADRYGVSLKQAQGIIKELRENPKKVEKLLPK